MTERLRLVHDLLDLQILDREGRKSGRVDGIVIQAAEGKQPRIVYIDVGTAVVARRLSHRLADWYEAIAPPFHIPWEKVKKIGRTGVETDIDAPSSEVYRLERWLRDHIIGPIPGSEHEHRK